MIHRLFCRLIPCLVATVLVSTSFAAPCPCELEPVDTTPPILACPTNTTVQCGSSTDPSNTGSAGATDDCDPSPTVAFSDSLSGDPCPGGSVITRTWTATDCSGNIETCEQIITVPGLVEPCALPNPLSRWRAEGGAADAADGNHGILVNGTTFGSGQLGQAFSLDGLNDYVRIPDSPSLRPVNLTLEGWFNFSATDSTRLLISKTVGVGFVDSFQLLLNGGMLQGAVGDASGFGAVLNHPFTPTLGQWYHIVYTFDDASDTQTLYVDGNAVASGTTTHSIGYDAHPVLLGADVENEVPSFFFDGRIDEVSIYDHALIGVEVATLFHQGGAGKDNTPPVISCPADTTADCDTWTNPVVTGMAAVTDECDPSPTVSFADTTAGGPCAGTLFVTRTWTAVDHLGNTASCDQIITVTSADSAAPTLACPVDTTMTCGFSTDPSATGTGAATDNCDPSPAVTFSDSVTGDPCPGASVITRTWTATDCSGNVQTCEQIITVHGLVAPCTLPLPLSWWRAEDNAADSTGSNGGTLINGATFGSGQLGQAFSLDGLNDHVRIPDAPSLRPANLTLEGWFKFGAVDSIRLLISKTVGSGFVDSFQLLLNQGMLQGAVGDVSGFGAVLNHPFTPVFGHWYHIVYTFDDGSDTQALYVNGELVASGTTTKSIGYDAHPVLLGADVENETPAFFFNGLIDEAAIYNRALSGVEVLTLFNRGGAGKDATAPTLVCPADTTADCDTWTNPSLTGTPTATDECDPSPSVSFVDSSAGGPCAGTLIVTRTWTATDHLGNTATCQQTITVDAVDTIAPTLICPGDATLTCNSATDPSVTGTASATDNCDPGPAVTYSDSVDGAPCPGASVITRTWTATDCSGNVETCVQTITLTEPTIPCSLAGTVSWWKAEDNADDAANGNHGSLLNGTVFGVGQVGQAFSLDGVDDYISIPDAPSLRPANFTVEGWFNFSNAVTTHILVSKTLGSGVLDSFQVWTADGMLRGGMSDLAGFGPFLTHPFAPVLGQWYHIAYAFDDASDTQTLYLDGAVVASGITTKSVNYDGHPLLIGADLESEVPSFFFHGLIDEVSFRDQALTLAEIQSIHAAGSLGKDDLPPTITCPADITIDCVQSTDPSTTGTPEVSDLHGSSTVAFVDSFVPGCGNSGIITRTWAVTDPCNNLASCVQVITIAESIVPSVVCPVDVTVECGGSTDPINTGSASGANTCGDVIIEFSDSFTPVCGSNGTITRTWRVIDDCGNMASCEQTLTVVDTIPPTLACPPDLTVECGASLAPAATGMPTGIDSCGMVTLAFSDVLAAACGSSGTITRTWIATDDCGNVTSCEQTVTVVDSTPPSLVCPPDATLECGVSTDPLESGMATGSDACGDVTVSFSDNGAPICGTTLSRTWTATDACGNTASCVQSITLAQEPPSITCPVDVTVECGASTDPASTGTPDVVNDCQNSTVTFSDEFTAGCGSSGTISRTWTVTGDCLYVASCVQVITIVDSTAPIVTCPPDVTVACGEPSDPAATGTLQAIDSCGGRTMSFVDSFDADCGTGGVITRTWTATDSCGNAVSCAQTITVSDTTPLTITCPADQMLQCGASNDPASTGTAGTSDACGNSALVYSDSVEGDCGSSGVITRTWTAADNCGNTVSCVQTITFIDTTSPSIVCPADVTVECAASIDPTAAGSATATDNCGVVMIGFSDNAVPVCGTMIVRTWTATDECGNAASCVQNITIREGPPDNDDFVGRFSLVGPVARATGLNRAATKETGEPDHAGLGGHSLWWTWTAPAAGEAVVATAGSGFNTLLAVYEGSTLADLTRVASNDDFADMTSQVAFDAVEGTTYQIAVDGLGQQTGMIHLTLSQGGASRLDARLLSPSGPVEFSLVGQANTNYVVEVSSNAVDWTVFLTLPNITGTSSFTDPDAGSFPYRFVRARRE